jgi:hypothetical protein
MKAGDYVKTTNGSIVMLVSKLHTGNDAWHCITVYGKDIRDIVRQRIDIVFEPSVIPVTPIFIEE